MFRFHLVRRSLRKGQRKHSLRRKFCPPFGGTPMNLGANASTLRTRLLNYPFEKSAGLFQTIPACRASLLRSSRKGRTAPSYYFRVRRIFPTPALLTLGFATSRARVAVNGGPHEVSVQSPKRMEARRPTRMPNAGSDAA